MPYAIKQAAVIGAGTMGAAIAAHLANAGIPNLLLDIVPAELNPDEAAAGLGLDSPVVRNRLTRQGLERCLKARPANFFLPDFAERITIGNLEDDFERLADVDFIVEAVVERLDIKQALMARIDKVRKPGCIVATNTSGIPIHQIAEGRSESFQQHFMGMHFFNPPRYLKLLELIPHQANPADLIEFVRAFATDVLGKGVVLCKDTPNFIANRILSIAGSQTLSYALEQGYCVAEVDAMTGPAIGRPKTATFRLNDLVGIDVLAHVSENLYAAIPHDQWREALVEPKVSALIQALIKNGWLGNKTGIGFYKKVVIDGERQFLALNLQTLEHEAEDKPRFESIDKGKSIDDVGERLAMLVAADDRAGAFIWHVLSRLVVYAANCIPEISDTPLAIDQACRWGFNWELGPFETWDALGLRASVERMQAEGLEVPAWVIAMLAAGHERFYQVESGRPVACYNPQTAAYRPISRDEREIDITWLKAQGHELKANDSASLVDMGEGVLLLEFHSKANALDDDIFSLADNALDLMDQPQWQGMVVGNQGKYFCAGANIFGIAVAAQQGEYELIDEKLRQMQGLLQRIRFSPKPIVAAPFNITVGGGCELVMAAPRVVAAAETYIGLVEVGIGLVPGGGGCKEIVRRVISAPMRTPNARPLPFLQQAFEQIGLAKVATSADEARRMGILGAEDEIVMNADQQLWRAKKTVLDLAPVYTAASAESLYAAGRDAFAALRLALFQLQDGGYASEHDVLVGRQLGYILTGGDLSAGQWASEDLFLGLERQAFIALCKQPKTIERMWYMLQHNKPLRN
jgi:3-hydroxyacyl-CoA dehydrogenase